jgi:hypothetical protein
MASVVDPGNVLSFSQSNSDGVSQTFGDGFPAKHLLYGDRYRLLNRRQQFYDCANHNHKEYDFDGRMIGPRSVGNPLISQSQSSVPYYVPLAQRRPSAPYRLPRIIVNSFTSLLFGEQRFPLMHVDGDEDSEDYTQTLARVGRLPVAMIKARALGGGMGSVGISWAFMRGSPRFEVHNAKNLYFHAWHDRAMLIPKHVSEVTFFSRQVWNGKEFATVPFWSRRDWTQDSDLIFKPVVYMANKDPYWILDEEKSVHHDDGVCHFEWIQNLPTEEIDGTPDYDGLDDQFEAIDILTSVVAKGGALNLDPTLVLNLDPDMVDRMGVRKGSDNALVVGEGDAKYLELSGQSIQAGLELVRTKRGEILETAQCVIPDPDQVAAQGSSSVARKVAYAPMLSKCDILREQYGSAIERIMTNMLRVARSVHGKAVTAVDPNTGEEREGTLTIVLPPKVEKALPTNEDGSPMLDETGAPIPEQWIRIPRVPGEGGDISLKWPPYFTPTPDDQTKIVSAMQIATGGKSFMPKQSASEIVAEAYGRDPAHEWARIEEQAHQEKKTESGMTPPVGGEVDSPDQLPDGALARRKAGEAPPPPDEGGDPAEPKPDGGGKPFGGKPFGGGGGFGGGRFGRR